MVGQLSNRRGAVRPIRRVDNNKGMRSNYGNIKKKLVAKAVNHARRNGVRPNLQNEMRAERPRRRQVPEIDKRLELDAPGKLLRVQRGRRGRRRPRIDKQLDLDPVGKLQDERSRGRPQRPMKKLEMEASGSKMQERPLSRVVRPNFGMRPRELDLDTLIDKDRNRPVLKNNVPRRDDSRRRERGPTRVDKRPEQRGLSDTPPRMARRSPPQPFPDERRPILHRDPPPGHHAIHSFPIRDDRMRHEEPRGIPMRRSPPRQMYPPRMREENRGHRDVLMPPMEKGPMFYERFKEAPPRGRMPESGRSMATPPDRDSMLRRNRSPQRNKRVSRTERDEELVKRPRDGPSRVPEKHYGHLDSPRMIPRGLEVLHRRPAPERGPHYAGRGLERPPIGLDYPRARSITPPSLRLMKAFPPRGHIRDLESDYRLMRSGRREEFPHGREPVQPPFEFGRERVRMEPYAIPDFRVRMLPSRRSMEREMERRDREWHPPPLPRLAGSISTRGRSAERNSRYNMPGSNYHFDPLSRR